MTGGISGNGNVTNSYNLGTVTGAAGKTYNISGGTVVNSYYADIAGKTGIYVKDSAGITDADKSQSITITEVDGKKAYKVGNVELVDVLNGACKIFPVHWSGLTSRRHPITPCISRAGTAALNPA